MIHVAPRTFFDMVSIYHIWVECVSVSFSRCILTLDSSLVHRPHDLVANKILTYQMDNFVDGISVSMV